MPSPLGSQRSFTVDAQSLRQAAVGEKWHSFLVVLNDALRSITDPVEMEARACALISEALNVDRVCYLEICEAEDRITIAQDALRNGAVTTVGNHRLADFAWAVAIFKRGQCLVIEDTQHSPFVPEAARDAVAALSVIGCIGAPVLKGDSLVGALCANVARPRGWKYEELWLLENVSQRVWAAILQARTAQALHAKSVELEYQAAQLRRLASELTLAEHNTRSLLSRTLHDGVQQFLFAAKFALQSATARLGPDESLELAQSSLKEAIEAARSLSVDLFPPVLHNNGLPDALEWLASWVEKKYGRQVTVDAHPQADPSAEDARILIFESVRELIFNSVKHAHTPTIRVSAKLTAQDEVCVEVSDDGAGFAAANLFKTTSTGYSLGLVAIRERLKILGGSMFVDSSPGHGCRVRVQIPRHSNSREALKAAVQQPPPAMNPAPNAKGSGDAAKRPLRVLIVDDHPVCRDGLHALLETQPELKVVGKAQDGAEAIEKTAELAPDVVVMDVVMPVLDGVRATAVITKRFPAIKVFGLSIDSRAPGRVHPIERAGAAGFFSKQTDSQPLVTALVRLAATCADPETPLH